MLNIKKYANGRFFDIAAKKYIKAEKLAEMIKKGEKIQVTLTKTGKDITKAVIGQFSKKEDQKKNQKNEKKKGTKKEIPFMKTEKIMKWLGEVIDSKIDTVMDAVKLPTRDQVAKLDKNIKELNDKIDALKLSREKATKAEATKGKTTKAKAVKGKTATKKPAAPKKQAAPKKPAAPKKAAAAKKVVETPKKAAEIKTVSPDTTPAVKKSAVEKPVNESQTENKPENTTDTKTV
jgi:polyhydroxyalkanoate synthesis regulator protein